MANIPLKVFFSTHKGKVHTVTYREKVPTDNPEVPGYAFSPEGKISLRPNFWTSIVDLATSLPAKTEDDQEREIISFVEKFGPLLPGKKFTFLEMTNAVHVAAILIYVIQSAYVVPREQYLKLLKLCLTVIEFENDDERIAPVPKAIQRIAKYAGDIRKEIGRLQLEIAKGAGLDTENSRRLLHKILNGVVEETTASALQAYSAASGIALGIRPRSAFDFVLIQAFLAPRTSESNCLYCGKAAPVGRTYCSSRCARLHNVWEITKTKYRNRSSVTKGQYELIRDYLNEQHRAYDKQEKPWPSKDKLSQLVEKKFFP